MRLGPGQEGIVLRPVVHRGVRSQRLGRRGDPVAVVVVGHRRTVGRRNRTLDDPVDDLAGGEVGVLGTDEGGDGRDVGGGVGGAVRLAIGRAGLAARRVDADSGCHDRRLRAEARLRPDLAVLIDRTHGDHTGEGCGVVHVVLVIAGVSRTCYENNVLAECVIHRLADLGLPCTAKRHIDHFGTVISSEPDGK